MSHEEDPGAWAQTASGRVFLLVFGVIVLILFCIFGSPFHSEGSYRGGDGSSHKGGTYENRSTDNHYTKH